MGDEDDEQGRDSKLAILIIVILSFAVIVSASYVIFGTTTDPQAHELEEIVDVASNDGDVYVTLSGATPDGYILVESEQNESSSKLTTRGQSVQISASDDDTLTFIYNEGNSSGESNSKQLGTYNISKTDIQE